MDDIYYRELIDKVLFNEDGLRVTGEKGYEDFSRLWDIVNDEDLKVTDKTYFDALDLCIESFWGSIQNPYIVWKHISDRYMYVSHHSEQIDEFVCAFIEFLANNHVAIPLDIFYELMHNAIEVGNLDVACGIISHSPIEIESWDQLENDYPSNPEWAAYIECLTDISFDHLPDDPIFGETVKRLYSRFGHLENMGKLRGLYNQLFLS